MKPNVGDSISLTSRSIQALLSTTANCSVCWFSVICALCDLFWWKYKAGLFLFDAKTFAECWHGFHTIYTKDSSWLH